MRGLIWETVLASSAYLAAFFFTFKVLMPIQGLFFPEFTSQASLLFLPHGVRVLTAWLIGLRAIAALTPGVFLAFLYIAGLGVFEPSRLAAIAVAVTVAPLTFLFFKSIGQNLEPHPDRRPCWICIMGAGIIISVVSSVLTNVAFGSLPGDYFAYLIGDISGLFFLMMALMYFFRIMRSELGQR